MAKRLATGVPLGRMAEYEATLKHPERTARRCFSWDYHYQEWPNRESMARSIRMQERAGTRDGWRAVVPLGQTEGY